MDFYEIVVKDAPKGSKFDFVVTVDFIYGQPQDLVCKGGQFYAFWDAPNNLWNTSAPELYSIIDKQIREKKKEIEASDPSLMVTAQLMRSHASKRVTEFLSYTKQVYSIPITFNSKIFFKSQQTKKSDYATTKLHYDPEEIETPAFDELINILYKEEEVEKILWFMGLILTSQSKDVQKFMYLYGGKGTGKGTVINIFRSMFPGYVDSIDLQVLTSGSEFATAQIKDAPLLIDDDSDMSKITKDVNLLKMTAHEPIPVNKKFASLYDARFMGTLITASNQRYQVRNVDSGITRRAVVIEPSGERIDRKLYDQLIRKVEFEIPGIAHKAIEHIHKVGIFPYENTMDVSMAEATDLIFSFVREYRDRFTDVISLAQAAALYKEFLDDLGYDTKGYKRRIKIELQRYYDEFHANRRVDGVVTRNVFVGLKRDLIFPEEYQKLDLDKDDDYVIGLGEQQSILDDICKYYPAQLANNHGTPSVAWDECSTTLKDIDSRKLHYLRVPVNHIVIDFDLKDSEGNKSLYLNLQEASKFPETYAEVSKSGNGIHLHYYFDGDVEKLAPTIADDVEVKVFTGKQSVRRKLTKCNNKPITHISTGIPYKEETIMLDGQVSDIVWNEKKIRTVIEKNLGREYHAATKPSIDFIAHILDEAQKSGVLYDVSDMKNAVIGFAMNSTHNAEYCMRLVAKLPFTNMEDIEDNYNLQNGVKIYDNECLYFYDIEVFPNLLIVAFKKYGMEEKTVWYNPTPAQIEWLLKLPLVGFNCRRYDNHIMYSALMGQSNLELYHQSKQIIDKNSPAGAGMIGSAYELSYVDIYEYATEKMSLKKWEVKLGIHHDELEFDWDKPLPEDQWERAGEYCGNDVNATEEVFDYTQADYKARLILSQLTGLSVNTKTQTHAEKWIFGDDPRPQDKFVYTDLAKTFPGYKFAYGEVEKVNKKTGETKLVKEFHSEYRGMEPSEGGFVYSEPGVYENVVLLDVESQHPTSLVELNYFGPYTSRFKELLDTRLMIKHGKLEEAGEMFGGVLKPYLNEEDAPALSYALKIIINIVYGMTSAKFDNKFRHKDNHDNIVAKRGALFMIDLLLALKEKGVQVAHIKTDSIKIPGATKELIQWVCDFGKQYGYTFEHEATYSKMALVNKAVYICKYGWAQKEKKIGTWEAIGAQFADPYVYKTLFTKEELVPKDYAVTKQATAPIYIGDKFIGKVCEVYASLTGEEMTRRDGDKIGAITGTKGYKWKLFTEMESLDDIDMSYYEKLNHEAIKGIASVGDVESFMENLSERYESLVAA